jgi:hypothetical protein
VSVGNNAGHRVEEEFLVADVAMCDRVEVSAGRDR